MHDPCGVRARQGVRDVDRQTERVGERRSLACQQLLEGLAVHQIHYQHILTVDSQHIVDSHDPGVVEG